MAGLWADHFAQYYSLSDMVQGAWASIGANIALSTANPPRAGGTHMRFTCAGAVNAGQMRRTWGSELVVAGWATRWYYDHLPTKEPQTDEVNYVGACLRQWRNSVNNVQLTTIVGTDGAIAVYEGEPAASVGAWAAALLYRSVQCIYPQTHHLIEDRITVGSGTSGNYELRVDGVTRINISAINTDIQGTGDVSQASTGIVAHGGTFDLVADFSDTHAWNDLAGEGPVDFVGNTAVFQRAPNADTADADWALSTGSSGFALLVDKTDATYISASTIGQKSGFLASALPAGTTGIVYQQLSYRASKTDGADCDVAPGFKSGGFEADTASQPMTMGIDIWRLGIVASDPATSGGNWSEASVNASELTFTRTA